MNKLLIILMTLLCAGVYANPMSLEDYAKRLEYYNAVLSPDGRYIAVERAADEGKTLVAVVDSKSLELVSHIPATSDRSPIRPQWVTNDRLVVNFTKELKRREHEAWTGELTAMNADGKNMEHLILQGGLGIMNGRVVKVTTSGAKRGNMLLGSAELVHELPGDKKYVIIRFHEYGRKQGKDPIYDYYKINILNGRVKHITKAPSELSYLTFSELGEPLFSVGLDKSNKKKNVVVTHQYVDGKWQKLNAKGLEEAEEIHIISQAETSNEVYVNARYLNKTDRIYRYNLETGEKTLVFAHAKVDPDQFVIDEKTQRLVAVHFEDGEPNLHLIDETHIYSQWYPSLFGAFQGKRVRITSATKDGSKMIIHVSGANEPGQFHLFNTETKKMRYLFNAALWVKTEQLAKTQAINFKARDGLEIHGYLTRPNEADKNVPLIVLPHGGPHGPRDRWTYNPEIQFLASRGYAVLQVNFRGSGGYGLGFEKAGYRQWGGKIQHDIIDGTRWALAQEGFDKDKVCIMGGSFGGYSALMSPILAPDLYNCAIGFVGVYDLELMYSTGDIETRDFGESYLKEVIGEDKQELAKYSPVKRIDELKAPVLIIHGEDDWRVDVKHFEVLKEALEEKGHPHESMLVDREGHGFANELNRIEFLKRVEKFLEQHLGS